MGLFTNPVVLDTAHTFSYRGQVYDKRSQIGEYIETAATIASESLLRVKHDPNGAVPRHLLQRSVKRVPAAGVAGEYKRITVNFTVVADPLFTDTEVSEETAILIDALGEANFVKYFLTNQM